MVSKFMDNEKTDNYYIKKIIGHLENIVEFLNGVDEECFYNSKVVQSAVCFEFVQIYENAKEIDNNITDVLKDFPLHELRGFRNRLVHEYGHVDYTVIYKSAMVDVPNMLERLKQY